MRYLLMWLVSKFEEYTCKKGLFLEELGSGKVKSFLILAFIRKLILTFIVIFTLGEGFNLFKIASIYVVVSIALLLFTLVIFVFVLIGCIIYDEISTNYIDLEEIIINTAFLIYVGVFSIAYKWFVEIREERMKCFKKIICKKECSDDLYKSYIENFKTIHCLVLGLYEVENIIFELSKMNVRDFEEYSEICSKYKKTIKKAVGKIKPYCSESEENTVQKILKDKLEIINTLIDGNFDL